MPADDLSEEDPERTNFDRQLRAVHQDARALCADFEAETERLEQLLASPALTDPERQRALNQTRTVTLQILNRMTSFLSKLTAMAR